MEGSGASWREGDGEGIRGRREKERGKGRDKGERVGIRGIGEKEGGKRKGNGEEEVVYRGERRGKYEESGQIFEIH